MQTLNLPRSFLLTASSPLSSPRLHLHLHLLLFFRSPFSSFSSSSCRRTEFLRQQNSFDEESRSIKVSVWWDYENCAIPSGTNVHRIGNRIISALRSSGIRGPVTINAFGDMCQIPRATQEALVSTGICLTHAPHKGKNSADRLLMADMIGWTAHNPPPAHFFLISNDSDFATILHRLRMSNYNVLLSCLDFQVNSSLHSAATLIWPWILLAKGKNFTAKQFNHPPDGMYGSWYGHQKGLLCDPLEEEPMERVVKIETPTIPKSVVNGICQVLHSYPDGIPLSVLRTEVRRKNILNDDLFGFNKFSDLIDSMPDIVSIVRNHHGNRRVFLTRKRFAKLVDKTVEPPCAEESSQSAELEQAAIKGDKPSQEKSSGTVKMIQLPTEPVEPVDPSLELDIEKTDQVDDMDKGIFGRFRKVFYGNHKNSEKANPVVKCEEDSSASLPVSVPVAKDKLTENNQKDEPKEKHAVSDRGLFGRIGRWFGFGREKGGSNLFADHKFWSDVESFLTTLEGSDLVAKSRTREELMQGLHNAGMLSLKSLEEAHIIQLIDLLISEKKWIQENTSSTFPFTLSFPSASTPSTTSHENLPQSITNPDQLSIKKPPSIPSASTPSTTSQENLPQSITNPGQLSFKMSPPKKIMLSDFRKVVKELLDEKPEGFQMGIIKPIFERKFGYMLEYRKLGYPRLVSLLLTIPDIKIVGKDKVCKIDKKRTKIGKNKVCKIDNIGEDVVDGKNKVCKIDNIGEDAVDSNEEDSVFDELGPISEEITHEPSLSDEEFSDESETKESTEFNGETTKEPAYRFFSKKKEKTTKEQSSLTEIVDTFASTKDGDAMRKEPLGLDEIVDCSRRYFINRSEFWLGDSVSRPRFLRSQKGQYKFVADEVEDEKKKIVDSILGTLKKNGDPNFMGEGKGI